MYLGKRNFSHINGNETRHVAIVNEILLSLIVSVMTSISHVSNMQLDRKLIHPVVLWLIFSKMIQKQSYLATSSQHDNCRLFSPVFSNRNDSQGRISKIYLGSV